jgi:hypothetical protein
LGLVETKQCTDVDAISQTTEGERNSNAKDVRNATGEKPNDGEGSIKRSVSSVASMGVIVKTCCAYPIDGIEHACAVSVTCLLLG